VSIFREVPPTAGFPLYWSDLFPLFKFGHDSAGLEEDFKKYLGVNFAKVTYSGTASFYFILEGLKEISPKKAVIIPAFVCPLVPLAIARAGLKVKVCDIQPDNFNFDYNTLEKLCAQGDVLAIVAVHLAGLAIDVDKLKNLAEKHGIFLIEDCAQSLGAQYKGKKIGTFGDFAFYSLCRGKGLTIYRAEY